MAAFSSNTVARKGLAKHSAGIPSALAVSRVQQRRSAPVGLGAPLKLQRLVARAAAEEQGEAGGV